MREASPRPGDDAPGPFVVGIGGSMRVGSSTEAIVRAVLDALERFGARSVLYAGESLLLPVYDQTPACAAAGRSLVEDVRRADALVVGSPGYHGSISGLVKNVLDYLEELRDDDRPYLDGRPVACITTALGWQGAVNSLTSLRQVVHALRGWPTPFGLALNVEGGLLAEDGSYRDPVLRNSVATMAGQILDFTDARRALRDGY